MNTSYGWIKLYRCLMDDPVWQCSSSEQKVILVTLLMMANHAERKWEWNGMPFQCQPGQMITSQTSIQGKVGQRISITKIRPALRRFEKMEFLANQSTKHNRLITICNWEFYQSQALTEGKAEGEQWTDDSQTMDNQRASNKNVKNEKKGPLPFYLDSESEDLEGDTPEELNDKGLAEWLVEPG